jgi:hypothetical protein
MAFPKDCVIQDILFDTQPSGILLICAKKKSMGNTAVIGEVLSGLEGKIVVSKKIRKKV